MKSSWTFEWVNVPDTLDRRRVKRRPALSGRLLSERAQTAVMSARPIYGYPQLVAGSRPVV
jgi:hypothetical protein